MGRERFTIYLAALGMEICWLQAWSEFLLSAFFHCQVPILFTLIFYLGGALAGYFCRIRNWMIIQVILIQLAGLVICGYLALYGVFFPYNGNPPDLDFHNLAAPGNQFAVWGFFLLALLIGWIIWRRGITSIARPLNHDNMYHRFELGIAALVTLMIVHAITAIRYELPLIDPLGKFQYIPFFVFGLMAIGTVITANHQEKNYAAGFQKTGVVLTFSILVLAVGVGVVLLFQSQLAASAEIVSSIAQRTGQPLGSLFVRLVRWLWGPRQLKMDAGAGNAGNGIGSLPPIKVAEEAGIFEIIVSWLIIGLAIVMLFFCLYYIIRALIRFLARRTAAETVQPPSNWMAWIKGLVAMLTSLAYRCRNWLRQPECGREFYAVLSRWGKASSVRRKRSETPFEYASRLIQIFPTLEKEISLLVEIIHLEIYGERRLNRRQIEMARHSCKTLSHPRHWPRRFLRWQQGE